MHQNGLKDFSYKQCIGAAALSFATSVGGSWVGNKITKNIKKTGDNLIAKGKNIKNKGLVRKSIGKSHSKYIKQGEKYRKQGQRVVNKSQGISAVIGIGIGAPLSITYTYLTKRFFGW